MNTKTLPSFEALSSTYSEIASRRHDLSVNELYASVAFKLGVSFRFVASFFAK